MAQNPLIKRYLDAGMAFTAMTQARAEAIVKDLVRTGEVQAQRGEELVNQIVERSRKNRERLLDVVRAEVKSQVATLGLATREDVARLEKELAEAKAEAAAAKKAAVKKGAAKKGAAKKAAVKKGAAKKATAKKATATKPGPGAKKAAKASKARKGASTSPSGTARRSR